MSRHYDEIAFYQLLQLERARPHEDVFHKLPFATDYAAVLSIPEKRAYYLLDKWTNNGWWDYGVSLRSGWFTPEAPAVLTP